MNMDTKAIRSMLNIQCSDMTWCVDTINELLDENERLRLDNKILREYNSALERDNYHANANLDHVSRLHDQAQSVIEQLRKELDVTLDQSMRELKASDEAWKKERRENEQLQKQLEKATNERNTFRDYLAITVQALSVVEETLGKQNIMGDARLWLLYTKIYEALSKTKNDPMNKEGASCLHGMNCSRHHPATDERYGEA